MTTHVQRLLVAVILAAAGCGSTSTNQNQSCVETCTQVIAAGCDNGPADVADCEQGCRETGAACPDELAAVMECAGPDPVITCNAAGIPVPQGCDTEQDALYACLGTLRLDRKPGGSRRRTGIPLLTWRLPEWTMRG